MCNDKEEEEHFVCMEIVCKGRKERKENLNLDKNRADSLNGIRRRRRRSSTDRCRKARMKVIAPFSFLPFCQTGTAQQTTVEGDGIFW